MVHQIKCNRIEKNYFAGNNYIDPWLDVQSTLSFEVENQLQDLNFPFIYCLNLNFTTLLPLITWRVFNCTTISLVIMHSWFPNKKLQNYAMISLREREANILHLVVQ